MKVTISVQSLDKHCSRFEAGFATTETAPSATLHVMMVWTAQSSHTIFSLYYLLLTTWVPQTGDLFWW